PSKSLTTIVFEDYFDFLIKAAVDLLWRRLSDKQEPGKPPRPESLAALLAATAFDDLAGMAARFFKQGLRVPIDASQQSTEALYELLGTQVRIPSSATTFEVALTPRGDVAPWFAVGSVAPRLEIDDPPALFAELASLKIEPKAKITQVVPVTTDQRRFALQRWSEWDRAGQAELLWTLPEALTRELRSGNAGTLKLEVSKTEHAFRDADAEEITGGAWATRVDLTIRRVARRDGTIIPNVYEVGGATERNRHDLDELLQVIGALAPRIELLYRAGTRLRSDAVAASDVLLFRGNYSTETTPPPEVLSLAMTAAEVPRDRATMDDAAAFLTLAQECSLVNTGGYFLRYGDGAVNLDAAFSTGADVAVISLVVTGTGTAARRHHNALAIAHAGTIAEAVKDESRLVFYAESSKREVIARLEPGCIAFAVERENPELLPDSLGRDLEILYNLLEYRVPQQPGIRASKESLPLTPVRRDANDTAWHYEQVIPIHALADPPGRYAAVGKKVVVDFDFRDCFGNKLGWKGAGARQTFDVLYFDRLLGAGAWPSVASTYTVQKAGADARIVITLAFDPKPFESQTQDARGDVAARFARIAEQLTGPGVSIAVRASLLGTKAHQLTTQQRDDLVAFVRRVHSFLGKGGTPPGATTLMVPVPRVVETPAFFELTVSLEIARDARLVDPSAVSADDEEARRVETFIPPFTPAGGTTAASLREFAEEIEAAIPAIRVAVGSA
ncbi:MAG TPA: hypothetical protein VHK90_13950, partial [Thermoanaerobaculia bacterium]|nr:hypothetical protein [Thermoanaerobaculia bacterium]